MQNDVYDYTSAGSVQRNTVLRRTYGLLVLLFAPTTIGALVGDKMGFNLYAMLDGRWMSFIVVMTFFYDMIFLIKKNRYSNVGTTLLIVFIFNMGVLLNPLLQYTLNFSNGTQIVGVTSVMAAAVSLTMSAMARRTTMNMSSLGRFLTVGAVILMITVVASFVLQIPALNLTISAGFVLLSSLVIMRRVRTTIDGGEDSRISAALTIFIFLYSIFSGLLRLLTALAGDN